MIRLTEAQLHKLIKESVTKILREKRELPEVHFCDSYEPQRFEPEYGVRTYKVLCEYGDSIVEGSFDMDDYNRIIRISKFTQAPYNRETRVADESKRHKISSAESEYIARQIVRSGQAYDQHDMDWWAKTEGIVYMIPR